jgi:large conductance mechanosensitive channel
MIKEFKEFAVKGSVMDMAVGIMIGAAFSSVIKSILDATRCPNCTSDLSSQTA